MRSAPLRLAALAPLAAALFAACAERPPAAPHHQDEVPIGLAREVPIEEDKAPPPPEDPVRAGGPTPVAVPTAVAASASPAASAGTAAKGPKISKSACQGLMKHYVKLVVAGNPALAGVPDNVVDQALGQTDAKMGGNPCDDEATRPTRAQADCAGKAKTKEAWEACLK